MCVRACAIGAFKNDAHVIILLIIIQRMLQQATTVINSTDSCNRDMNAKHSHADKSITSMSGSSARCTNQHALRYRSLKTHRNMEENVKSDAMSNSIPVVNQAHLLCTQGKASPQ
jgi:hypothetical protein